MSAWEALMWRSEPDPRTRSTGILLEVLAGEPDWQRFREAHVRTTTRVPRLRERVVEPLVPLVQPAWAPDPHFDLDHHVHSLRLHDPGDEQALLALCESLMRRPLDRARPPWEAILVTGLSGGRAAYLFKFHHSLTDGLGLIQLLTLAHSSTADPGGAVIGLAAAPGEPLTAAGLLGSRLRRRLTGAPTELVRRSSGAVRVLGRSLADPVRTTGGVARYAQSLSRMLAPPDVDRSPLLRGSGGVGNRLIVLDVPLDQLRAAGKAAGASVNDAFVAAVLGGLRRYHEHHGASVERLPIGMPVSLRRDNDPLGGNRFAGARFAAPLSERDPVVRMQLVREFVLEVREEPAIGFLDQISPTLTKLPASVIIELSAKLMTASDVQISNIRGLSQPVFLAGQEIVGMYPLGPRPGVAAMIAMITYAGTCCLGLNVDPDAVPDPEVLKRCLSEGFDEVFETTRAATRPRRAARG
ncbi:MAG: hypothetical protein JWN88_615 [Frankiales bacterium]|jgi:WS/DGAT/MGAT family acyltransferase|nr:hypothetical protein [Frankiales bacterium]